MIAEYFENQSGSTEPLSQIQNQYDRKNEEQIVHVLSPSSKSTHEFTYMPLISVEEVVKSLSKIEFDESKMDYSSSVPSDLMKSALEQPKVNPTQFKVVNQFIVEFIQMTGFEIVQYTDPLNFLADAAQIQIKKDTENKVIMSPPTSQSAQSPEQHENVYTE